MPSSTSWGAFSSSFCNCSKEIFLLTFKTLNALHLSTNLSRASKVTSLFKQAKFSTSKDTKVSGKQLNHPPPKSSMPFSCMSSSVKFLKFESYEFQSFLQVISNTSMTNHEIVKCENYGQVLKKLLLNICVVEKVSFTLTQLLHFLLSLTDSSQPLPLFYLSTRRKQHLRMLLVEQDSIIYCIY